MDCSNVCDDLSAMPMRNVSLVRYYDPGCIFVDFLTSLGNLSKVNVIPKGYVERLTRYWTQYETATFVPKEYYIGEVVAVKLTKTWRPALVTNNFLKNGIYRCEVLILETGHIIQTYRINIRPLSCGGNIPRRYMRFSLIDVVPLDMKEKRYAFWSVEACNVMNVLMKIAPKIFVKVLAVKKIGHYEQLFGNMFIQQSGHIIDVKNYLVKKNLVLVDQALFQRSRGLADQDYICCKEEAAKPILSGNDMQNNSLENVTKEEKEEAAKPILSGNDMQNNSLENITKEERVKKILADLGEKLRNLDERLKLYEGCKTDLSNHTVKIVPKELAKLFPRGRHQ